MAFPCSTCDAQFQSAAGVTQHVALQHNTCAECNEAFDETDALRNHIHENH